MRIVYRQIPRLKSVSTTGRKLPLARVTEKKTRTSATYLRRSTLWSKAQWDTKKTLGRRNALPHLQPR